MDDLDELITMLLALEPRYCPKTGEHLYDVPANRDGRLAVAAIEALTTERDALRAAIAWVNEVHPTNCDGYARVGMTFEEFAAMKAALQQKDRNDEN